MKYVIQFALIILPVICAAQSHEIASKSGSASYVLNFSKATLDSIFTTQIAPYIDPSSSDDYIFDDIFIDDPSPTDTSSDTYIVLLAHSASKKISIGLVLNKTVKSPTDIRLSITGPAQAREGDWKCSSTGKSCGLCTAVRAGGQVVGCKCTNEQDLYCEFEVIGGDGGRFPGWVKSLLSAFIRLI